MKKALLECIVAIGVMCVAFVSSGRAQRDGKADRPSSASGMPAMVYVADFEIDANDIGQGDRILNRPGLRQQDQGSKASRFVDLLADSLTGELQKRSVPAARFYSGQSIPNKGWLIKGEFLEVDEGNRLRRAVIGFGAGETDMQIQVGIVDLSSGSQKPFIVFGTQSESGKMPGAIVTMNPYVAAAKFVLSKRAPERDVAKTARQIAEVLVQIMKDQAAQSNK